MPFAVSAAAPLLDADPADLVASIATGLAEGSLVPYLGPEILALSGADMPASYDALAAFFAARVALPKRARGNPWSSAQYIESQKHRVTLTTLMGQAFHSAATPTPFQYWLAKLSPPLIVDSWYDGTLQTAFADNPDWGTIQAISRAGIGEGRWFRAYDRHGQPVSMEQAAAWRTILYQPHGAARPAANFLISDADYVEVLTEIDIQSPIPAEIQHRRSGKGFVFLGCRFHDQMLRTYARQITKRSGAPHYAVVQPETMERNERRFLSELGIIPVTLTLADVLESLASST